MFVCIHIASGLDSLLCCSISQVDFTSCIHCGGSFCNYHLLKTIWWLY